VSGGKGRRVEISVAPQKKEIPSVVRSQKKALSASLLVRCVVHGLFG
jgi:hypothetical protein